jgi:hypothetical protein
MVICWGMFPTKSRKALKTGWLITAGVLALYLGVIQPRDRARGIASQKATGLAAVSGDVGWEPISLWHGRRPALHSGTADRKAGRRLGAGHRQSPGRVEDHAASDAAGNACRA